jgi:hypothetical protein
MRLGETEIEFRNPERDEVHIIEVHIHPKHQTGTTHYNVGIAVAGLNLMALNQILTHNVIIMIKCLN